MAMAEMDLCAVCGRPAEVCQSPDRQDDWHVPAPVRCHATTALRERQATVTEETNPHTDALLWHAELRQKRG